MTGVLSVHLSCLRVAAACQRGVTRGEADMQPSVEVNVRGCKGSAS